MTVFQVPVATQGCDSRPVTTRLLQATLSTDSTCQPESLHHLAQSSEVLKLSKALSPLSFRHVQSLQQDPRRTEARPPDAWRPLSVPETTAQPRAPAWATPGLSPTEPSAGFKVLMLTSCSQDHHLPRSSDQATPGYSRSFPPGPSSRLAQALPSRLLSTVPALLHLLQQNDD